VVVELPFALDDLAGPGVTAGPAEGLGRQRRAEIGPVDHVFGREASPIFHREPPGAVFVVARVEVDGALVGHRRRIGGVNRLHGRVVRETGVGRERERRSEREAVLLTLPLSSWSPWSLSIARPRRSKMLPRPDNRPPGDGVRVASAPRGGMAGV